MCKMYRECQKNYTRSYFCNDMVFQKRTLQMKSNKRREPGVRARDKMEDQRYEYDHDQHK